VTVPETFFHERRIGFGDCDPARIFFAPRAFDFAMEALEACFREALGAPWEELRRQGLGLRVRSASCEYRRSAAASEVVRLQVATASLAAEAAALSVEGAVAGATCFEAGLEVVLVDLATGGAAPLPAALRGRLEALRLPAPPGPEVEARPPEAGAPGAALFTRPRRIRHGECGPDGLAYAPRLMDLAVEAVGEWYEEVVGLTWIRQCHQQLGTPFVSIRADLLRPLRAGQEVVLAVRAPRLGRASICYEVVLREPDGARCLEARMSACHISEASGAPQPRPFPDDLRARIEAHQRACRAAGAAE
jgi:4-hydroxybenzoyl-CoA thioesterase